ncbi:hypothetical protein [Lysobacter sp. Root690]|uniref:hypothetical protein n=1 Tax=Lysobacter sp. Root690 TaxID=1736588 RepID=UPI00138F0C42|nr:hypothetical protein [Lysobacter sp. Root690]
MPQQTQHRIAHLGIGVSRANELGAPIGRLGAGGVEDFFDPTQLLGRHGDELLSIGLPAMGGV